MDVKTDNIVNSLNEQEKKIYDEFQKLMSSPQKVFEEIIESKFNKANLLFEIQNIAADIIAKKAQTEQNTATDASFVNLQIFQEFKPSLGQGEMVEEELKKDELKHEKVNVTLNFNWDKHTKNEFTITLGDRLKHLGTTQDLMLISAGVKNWGNPSPHNLYVSLLNGSHELPFGETYVDNNKKFKVLEFLGNRRNACNPPLELSDVQTELESMLLMPTFSKDICKLLKVEEINKYTMSTFRDALIIPNFFFYASSQTALFDLLQTKEILDYVQSTSGYNPMNCIHAVPSHNNTKSQVIGYDVPISVFYDLVCIAKNDFMTQRKFNPESNFLCLKIWRQDGKDLMLADDEKAYTVKIDSSNTKHHSVNSTHYNIYVTLTLHYMSMKWFEYAKKKTVEMLAGTAK